MKLSIVVDDIAESFEFWAEDDVYVVQHFCRSTDYGAKIGEYAKDRTVDAEN